MSDVPELAELAELLDSGALVLLRDRYERPRRIKQILDRYTSRVWLFPFGVHPSPDHGVEIFRNGLAVYMGEEVTIQRVGSTRSVTVAVFDQPLREGDRVQATYIAVPLETPDAP